MNAKKENCKNSNLDPIWKVILLHENFNLQQMKLYQIKPKTKSYMEFDVKQLIPNPISKQTTSMFIKQKWQNHQNSTPCSCITLSNKKNKI